MEKEKGGEDTQTFKKKKLSSREKNHATEQLNKRQPNLQT